MIELCNVSVRSGHFLISEISLTISTGNYAVLMGKTGSGKTTLLETICGLRPVLAGTISLQQRDVTRCRPAARQIGYVPQDLALFPTMTVQEQLEFPLKIRGVSSGLRHQRVEELAEMLQIGPLLKRRPEKLSGGEAQRVALGRALSFRPAILLLDEPLSALDEETRGHVQKLLKEVHQSTAITVLHVTHSREEAMQLGDQIFTLGSGTLLSTSPGVAALE